MPRGKPKSKRRGRPSALARLSVADLMREVERRRNMTGQLMAQRDQLQRELEKVDAELAGLETLGGGVGAASAVVTKRGPGRPKGSGSGRGKRGGRGGNTHSLAGALHRLLQGRTLGVAEMADAVQKSGYKTKSPNFRTIVNAALLASSNKHLFRRVDRGQYTAK